MIKKKGTDVIMRVSSCVAEMRMICQMCGNTKQDKIVNDSIRLELE